MFVDGLGNPRNPGWRPRWPPIPKNGHKSPIIHPRDIILVSILWFKGSENPFRQLKMFVDGLGNPKIQDGVQDGRHYLKSSHKSLIMYPRDMTLVSISWFSGREYIKMS